MVDEEMRAKVVKLSVCTVRSLIEGTKDGDTVDLMVALENVVVGIILCAVKRGEGDAAVIGALFDGVTMRVRKHRDSGKPTHAAMH